MSASRRTVAAFSAAVAAAVAAVAWLVLSGSPSPAPAPPAPGPEAVKPPAPRDGPPAEGPAPPADPRAPKPPRERGKAPVLEIAGQVLDGAGLPAPGAAVTVFPHLADEADAAPPAAPAPAALVAPEILSDLFTLDPEEVARAVPYTGIPALPGARGKAEEAARGVTDEEGRFRLRVPNRNVYRVHASKEGAGSAVADSVSPGGEPAVLRLGPSAALEGRVVNLAGMAPVEGATVVVRSGSVEKGAVTGGNGLFRIEDLPPGTYSVTAGAAGLAPATRPGVEVPSEEGPVELGLGGGWAIRVLVMKWEPPPPGWRRSSGVPLPQGAPIEGARVVLFRAVSDAYVTAITGADGSARFEGLGEGIWRVGAVKEGYCVGSGGRDVRLRTGSPPEETREVRLLPAVATPLRVMDESGAPLAGARIYTGGRDEEFDEKASRLVGRTDAEGRATFTFDDGIPSKAVVWIVPESGAGAVMVEPEDAQSGEELKAVAPPGRAVQGTVRDSGGKPLAGAEVYLTVIDDEREIDIGLYAYTDASGAFRFPAVPFGETALEVDIGGEWDSAEFEADDRRSPLVQEFTLEAEEE